MSVVVDGRLPADPSAPAKARALVRQLPLDLEHRRQVELVVSELVTNSVMHADAAPDRMLSLTIERDGTTLNGEVCDEGRGFEWEQQEPDLGEPGGLGLMVVDQLTERWGITRNGSACVWFECVCADAT